MLRYRQLGVLGLLCLQFSPHVSTSLAPTVQSDKASEAFYRLSQPSPTQPRYLTVRAQRLVWHQPVTADIILSVSRIVGDVIHIHSQL